MPEFDLSRPQHQSKLGLILIFATSVFQLARNLWVVVVYFLVQDLDPKMLFSAIFGISLLLILTLGYSILYFYRFKFHIDIDRREFVLQKGVFSSDVLNIPFGKIQQVNFRRNILQRILGIYSVVIETAGSQEKEVEIKALSKEKADFLTRELMSVAEAEATSEVIGEEEPGEQSTEVLPEWEHKISFLTLLKLGLTTNYLRGLGIIMAFYFTLREQFMDTQILPTQLPDTPDFSTSQALWLIPVLLIISILVTVGQTFIQYYGLHLKKFRDSLQIEMGLRNNTMVNLKSRRVQHLEIIRNPVQRWLDLHKMKLSLASSQDDLEKSRIKIPGLPAEVVEKVKHFLYSTEVKEEVNFRPHRIYLMRSLFRSFIPVVAFILVINVFDTAFTQFGVVVLSCLYLVFIIPYFIFRFRRLKIAFSEDFLVKYSGVWNHKKEIVEMYRLQAVSVSQPLWYKRRGLVNLTFHSAAGDIDFPLVYIEEVKPWINYLLYRVESTEEAWM